MPEPNPKRQKLDQSFLQGVKVRPAPRPSHAVDAPRTAGAGACVHRSAF